MSIASAAVARSLGAASSTSRAPLVPVIAAIGLINDGQEVRVIWSENARTFARSKSGCRAYDEHEIESETCEVQAVHKVLSMLKDDALAFAFEGKIPPNANKELKGVLSTLVPKLDLSPSHKESLLNDLSRY